MIKIVYYLFFLIIIFFSIFLKIIKHKFSHFRKIALQLSNMDIILPLLRCFKHKWLLNDRNF